jgi:hypothetical protein
MNRDASPAADVFVIGALIRILKPSPTADIIDKDTREVRHPILNIADHLSERIPALDVQATLPLIRVGFNDVHVPARSVFPNHIHLVVGRVLLVFGGHADVSGCTDRRLRVGVTHSDSGQERSAR